MPKVANFVLAFYAFAACTDALRFSHVPVTVDTDVIVVDKPSKLTCNYVKFRTETVREINWFAAVEGFRSKIFHYHVTTGKKEDSTYSHVKTDGLTATEKELSIILPEFRGSPMTVGCEVEVLRDNGYGKLAHFKKMGEANITVVDTQGFQLLLKSGTYNGGSSYQRNYEAVVGQPLTVSCIASNSNPTPNLTLIINGQPWEQATSTAQVSTPLGPIHHNTKVIEGKMDTVYDSLFNQNGILAVECVAKFKDLLFEKKQLGLRRRAQQSSSRGSFASQQHSHNGHQGFGSNFQRQGRVQHISEGYDSHMIHSRLLDLLDPAKHMHPGVPYDFYSGYVIMVADNIDGASGTGSSYYGSSSVNGPTTYIYGRLPDLVLNDLQRNYGRTQKVSNDKLKITMDPVEVLNLLGSHGFRVIGFTAEADKKMVWTLEEKDFEGAIIDEANNNI